MDFHANMHRSKCPEKRLLEPAFGEFPWMRGQCEEIDVFPPQPFGVMDDGTRMVAVDRFDELQQMCAQWTLQGRKSAVELKEAVDAALRPI